LGAHCCEPAWFFDARKPLRIAYVHSTDVGDGKTFTIRAAG
jgi:hypothetical protein